MRVIFTVHAKTRMRQRGVSAAAVHSALKRPLLRKPSYPPTEIVRAIDKKGTLEVVFKQQGDICVVITAYYL